MLLDISQAHMNEILYYVSIDLLYLTFELFPVGFVASAMCNALEM